jgi:acyl dehydratase
MTMAQAAKADTANDTEGKITPDDIERARAQIGVPKFGYDQPFNRAADSNSMAHFAFGCGDDNPLYHDPDYARLTRWRGQIAAPLYYISAGIIEAPKPTAEIKKLMRGLFRGVGKYYSGVKWQWYRPLYAGDEIYAEHTTSDVQIKDKSAFSGGMTVIETYRHLYLNRLGEPLACREESYISAERGATKKTNKLGDVKRHVYTPADIERIDAVYAAEERRGALPRYFEDVTIGDKLIPVAKGPLVVGDVIGCHIGWGMGEYGIGPLRYAWAKRQKMPAFYSPDEYGVPDSMQRLHWDQSRAQELGLPAPYDYGQMRSCWLTHLVTNWMGDDAWLWSLETQLRAFNFMGDFTTCEGEVTGKRQEGAHSLVDLAIRTINQRGEQTSIGSAVVVVPSRKDGAIILPVAADEFIRRGPNVISEAVARQRDTSARQHDPVPR